MDINKTHLKIIQRKKWKNNKKKTNKFMRMKNYILIKHIKIMQRRKIDNSNKHKN